MDNINSDYYISQCFFAILFVEMIYIVERGEFGFENVSEKVFDKINASPLHDKDRL